jgi:hypothetical protein
MTTLDEIRKTVPQYSDLSDEALADAVYNKFYSDMPRDAFNLRIGLKPTLSIKDRAVDVAKSAGSGLVDAASGVAGLPGDLQSLASSVTVQPKTSPTIIEPPKMPQLPTSENVRAGIDKAVGFDTNYDPRTPEGGVVKSVTGHLPNTFVPLGRLGMGGRFVTQTAIPGTISEVFGQAAKGGPNEGEARAVGSMVGAMTPSATLRAFAPAAHNPQRMRAVNLLRREGIEPSAGQATGSHALRNSESTLGDAPFAGGGGTAMNERTLEQFTAAMLRRAGVNANRATQDVVDQAFAQNGGTIGAIASATPRVTLDPDFQRDLGAAVRDYHRMVSRSQRAPVVNEYFNDFRTLINQGGVITGERYQALRSNLAKLERANRGDFHLRDAITGMRNALDDAFERAVPPDAAATMREARGNYRQLMLMLDAITAAGEEAASGLIKPNHMRTALKQASKMDYARGRGELDRLVHAANEVLLPLPNSGTAQRLQALSLPATVIGGLTGGIASGDATTGVGAGLASGILTAVGPGMVGRGLTHPRVQDYIKHNLVRGQPGAARLRGLLSPRRNVYTQGIMQGPRGLLMDDEEEDR